VRHFQYIPFIGIVYIYPYGSVQFMLLTPSKEAPRTIEDRTRGREPRCEQA
jgi:hypothetical protein